MRLLHGIRAALASSSSIKFDGFAVRQWPVNSWPMRRRRLYNVAMPLPAHRRLLYCTTSMPGLDSEMYRMIILIPEPSRPKLPLPFLLTPRLHYLLISSRQKCSARSGEPLKSSAVSAPPRPLFFPLFSFLLVSSSSVSPHSVNHACPSRPSLPVPNRLFCSLGSQGRRRKGEKCVEGHRGACWGKSKSTRHLQQEFCCQVQPGMNAEAMGEIKTAGRGDKQHRSV